MALPEKLQIFRFSRHHTHQNLEPHQSNEEIQLWGSATKDTVFFFRSNFNENFEINIFERVWI
jgi:hypothetical protein